MYAIGIGQDAHQFEKNQSSKKCVIGGVIFEQKGFDADSDGDVVYHALCNALTCIHHVPILGDRAIQMCKQGEKSSDMYVKEALKYLKNQVIDHVSFTIEGREPRMQGRVYEMRQNISNLLGIQLERVGIVCTSGNNLSDCAKGLGVEAHCVLISRRQD